LGVSAVAIDLQDRVVQLADGAVVAFDRAVLAMGAAPRIPPVAGIGLGGVQTLRHADDARRLREQIHPATDVVVVGGGFIGLEIAATARALGKNVTVLEAAGRLMGRAASQEISAHFLALHRGWGIDVRLGTAVAAIVGEGGRVTAVETSAGDVVPAQAVVIGIGVVPNVGVAETAGLAVDNGVVVNDFMETSVPEVLAIGDLVSFDHWDAGRRVRLESVQNAVDQAKTAASTIMSARKPFRDVPWFWSDQGDAKLQMVGLAQSATQSVVRGSANARDFSVFHYAGERLVAVDSVNRAGDHMVGRRLLGAGISPAPEVVADEGTDLKTLLAPRA
jgi:3-phenylpropionate/trans-cinnamate dioxygenase ferredoxin reductase subunit